MFRIIGHALGGYTPTCGKHFDAVNNPSLISSSEFALEASYVLFFFFLACICKYTVVSTFLASFIKPIMCMLLVIIACYIIIHGTRINKRATLIKK